MVPQDANCFIESIRQVEENKEFRVELMEKMESYLENYYQLDSRIENFFSE